MATRNQSGKQGFASMDEKKQKEIASKGGKASHGSSGQSMSGKESGSHSKQGSGSKSSSK